MARKEPHQEPLGYTILVVDDQEDDLNLVEFFLEGEGHRVLTAASGEEALALFRPGQVHLVIVDYFTLSIPTPARGKATGATCSSWGGSRRRRAYGHCCERGKV